MILKWKTILTNWINCYSSEGDKREQNITPENLLNIFTHIHDSFRLDDSKSSKFEANTVQEFLVEKYPEFKFENGTLESSTEEEIYIVASLLLYFICVNSKNADIKRVMCSKLSVGDQETIMKFSKSLMDCSPIMYGDVEAAITEACGHDTSKVAETPPALRSLHGEVRRLQAALEAERFDRNYLQDELARTNLKMEKLTKIKEQYKLDILNLKAKISLCCGEQRESHREARADEFIGRLQRQLHDLEAHLEDTLGQLDDVQQERDNYIKKVSDLKEERDKWLTVSQQEADKASHLADQLDTERRTVATLRDLVSELRQHNRNNGLDSSMLECDYPDTSIQSLSNLSVCNEDCANVIEVQLGEERAKIEILKEQIQSLQEKLSKTNQIFESEKLSLEAVITEKETNISKLKKRISQEVEEKENLKIHYNKEIDKLNKKINDMTQLIKDLEESSKNALEQKVHDMELLQANFVHETNKLNNVIIKLQKEVDNVHKSKKKCEDKIALLNNNIGEMSQTIKNLEDNTKHVLEEKEQGMCALQQLFTFETEKSSNLIHDLQRDLREQKNLKAQCEQDIVELKNNIGNLSQEMAVEKENYKRAIEDKAREIQSLQQQFAQEADKYSILNEELQQDLEKKNDLITHHEQETDKLNNRIAEISQAAKAAEKQLKLALEEKIQEILLLKDKYAFEIKNFSTNSENLKKEIDKQNILRQNCEQENIRLNNDIVEMSQVIKNIEQDSKHALQEKAQEIQSLQQESEKDNEAFSTVIKRLKKEMEEQSNLKAHCEQQVVELKNKIVEMSQTAKTVEDDLKRALDEKVQEIQSTKQEVADENKKLGITIGNLQKELKQQINLRNNCEQEIIQLNNRITEMSQEITDVEESSKLAMEEKVQVIQLLHQEIAKETEKSTDLITKLQNETDDQKQEISKLSNKIGAMSQTIKNFEESSKLATEEKLQEIQCLKQQFAEETKKLEVKNKVQEIEILEAYEYKKLCDQMIVELNNEIVKMKETMEDVKQSSKLALEEKVQENQYLQQQFTIECEKLENIIKELNQELETEKQKQCMIKDDFDNRATKLNEKILNKNSKLEELKKEIVQKSEMIEELKLNLRKENKLRVELSTTCNNQALTLNEQKERIEELQRQLQEKDIFNNKLDKEVKNLHISLSNLEVECQSIAEEKQKEGQYLNQEIDKLKKDIIEKSRAIKDVEEISRHALDEKAQVIQTLHQQLAAESGKSENIIKNLKIELEAEKYAQLKLKDDFDNHFMKLNEKVLNRNNELVELQDNIIQNSEMIEVLQADLRREKELRDELSNTCNHQLSTLNEQKNAVETLLQQKLQEITELQKQLQEKEMLTIKLKNEVEKLNTTISSFEEKCRQRDVIIKEKQKEIEFINDIFQNEQEKLNHKMDERNASIKSLQMQLHDEIEYKMQLQHELSALQTSKQSLIEELDAAKILAKDYEEKSLLCEKQKEDMSEQIKINILKVEKLEEEKVTLQNEIKSLKDNQSGETKNHEEKLLIRENKNLELGEQLQAHSHKIEKLEEERSLLLKNVEELKAAQSDEAKNYEEEIRMREKQKIEMNEQMQVNILKIEKLDDEKILLMKEVEALKAARKREAKDYEDYTSKWKEQETEIKEQLQFYVLKIEKLEEEKALMIKNTDALTAVNQEILKKHESNNLVWEKQKIELHEELQANMCKVENLVDEKASLLRQLEDLQNTQNGEIKCYEENKDIWEKQKSELVEQLQENMNKSEKLEGEKTLLLKEIQDLKNTQNDAIRRYEETSVAWEKQRSELKEQVKASINNVEKLKDEKTLLLKEMEELKIDQKRVSIDRAENMVIFEDQKNEMMQLIQANIEEHKKEKISLINEIEVLKTTQAEETKSHEEKIAVWEKQTTDLKEQLNLNIVKVQNLEEQKSTLLKEMEALQAEREEAKTLEKKAVEWETQKTELCEQINSNINKVQKLEDEKATLLNEMEALKAAKRDEAKGFEEKTLEYQSLKKEMSEQIHSNNLRVQTLEEEKAILLKEIETVKAAYREEKTLTWERQKAEFNEQIRANVLMVEALQEEKTMLLKELEALKAAQMEMCFKKDHTERLDNLETLTKEEMHAKGHKIVKLEEEKQILLKELEALKAAQKEMLAMASDDKITGTKHTSWEKEIQGMHHQVDTSTSDLAHSSMDSLKTISDLEKIIQDKNRKITTMQTEITYIKSIVAESAIKCIDVTKELEISKDNCQELSSQLKKIVHQKNEEIAELRRQIAKMSATENRASQIIKVSAKYQAMILKRIAEIKSNAVLKELTNFGNQNSNGDNEMRRSFAGSVTMEDLENFLETTDKHLKRCSEKQLAMQKDRDRLSEVNRINESEIINMKKFLTEMSVSFRTFSTVKEVYNQKLSKIVSLQRTVRRDILSLDGRITEATMCKLERGYAAVMQDLSECALNLERWVDRSVSRMLSAEKIKQAFTSDLEPTSLSTCNYQNAAVEVQLSELENSFQKLLAEIGRAQKGEGARTAQEVTIMEVRAEYEDKLNRMKAKMKELFHEEMGRLKQKQADELAILERELVKSREKMAESSRAYEEHIRALTSELWSVGEKFLVKQEEADWLRRKQSGSLMSLQHVHSSGLQPPKESFGRPSDTHSLRSLPVHNKKSEGRGLHMSDEEGEVFDNRFLKELSATPRPSLAPGQRISELKRRNSLVPPHLKSSYPAEMQFAPTLDEEDIKCASFSLGRSQRKEVGITAYKKPGPPTPSKQAGRLSATDSELRESLRTDPDAQAGRKTSTPSRIRSLFRSNRNDTDVGTPRSRRFSNIFRKK